MIVRRLTVDDGEHQWNLRLQALQDSPEGFGSTYEETIARGYESYIKRLQNEKDSSLWFGAFEHENRLIGMLGIVHEQGLKSHHKGYIVSMYVIPEARGKGVGKALLNEAITQASNDGSFDQLQLAVVTTNDSARQLYRSLGFEVYGIEPRALKKDGHYWDEELMILKLR